MTGTIDWTSVASQIPVVLIFMWFSFEMWKRFIAELDKRDQAFEKRNQSVCEALDKLATKIDSMNDAHVEHQAMTRVIVDEIQRPGRKQRVGA